MLGERDGGLWRTLCNTNLTRASRRPGHRALELIVIGRAVLAALALSGSRALADPRTAAVPEGHFVDRDGGELPFAPTYERWFGDARREPHYLHAAGSLGALLALGSIQYYGLRLERNRGDWDDPSLKDRLTFDAVRFDDNPFADNHLHHPLSGSLYHWVSRANGLGVYAASAYAFGASTVWEFAFEFREMVGLNDLIITPVSGIAAGEFFFQLGQYVNSAPEPSPLQDVPAYTLGLVNRGYRELHGEVAAPPSSSDALGFSSAFWHRFRLDYEYASVENEAERAAQHAVVGEAKLVAMPGFLRPGRFETGFAGGNFTAARARLAPGGASFREADLWFDARLAGYYSQDFVESGQTPWGQSWLVAWSTAFRYVDRHQVGARDQYAIAHLGGPSFEAWTAGSGWLLRVAAAVHLDFGAIRSLAYSSRRETDSVVTKSSLEKHRYYFGPGVSGSLEAALSYTALEVGARAAAGHYGSIEGRDRFQETLRDDTHLTDDLIELGAFLSVAPESAGPYGRLSLDQTHHRSHLGDIAVTGRMRRWSVAGGIAF
jgi:hypothetical protein